MMELLQLELPVADAAEVSEVIGQTRATGILPRYNETAGFSDDDMHELCRAFIEGSRSAVERQAAADRVLFAARGWAFKWFMDWRPANAAEGLQADAIDEALDVVRRHFPAIAERGLGHFEDMGILQSKGWGGSEGVQAKQESYGELVLVSVHCVTGPTNFDAATGEVEFEAGARSHVFHLLYRSLPTLERLSGDLAAYPVIHAPENRDGSRAPCGGVWQGEGWTGTHATRPRLHRPWDTVPKNVNKCTKC